MFLEQVWEERNRTRVLLASGAIILALALVDWRTEPYVSLGFLYLFPIMLAAGFLPRWAIAFLGLACAVLSEVFSSLDKSIIRLVFETLALAGCGLFVGELLRTRRLNLEAQEKIRILVETSPAAVVTVNDQGFIELANRAAAELIAPHNGNLVGYPIAAFLPELHHALRREEGPQFRASMQCRGKKDDRSSGRRCNAGDIGVMVRPLLPTFGSPPIGKGRHPSWPRSSRMSRKIPRGPKQPRPTILTESP
jgi:PAS domain-containing protein